VLARTNVHALVTVALVGLCNVALEDFHAGTAREIPILVANVLTLIGPIPLVARVITLGAKRARAHGWRKYWRQTPIACFRATFASSEYTVYATDMRVCHLISIVALVSTLISSVHIASAHSWGILNGQTAAAG
jgi:hypothetical protein